MRAHRKNASHWLLAVGIATLSLSARAELAIVAHPSNPEARLSVEQVQRIYLGKVTSFPLSGSRVTPVDQKDGGASKEKFLSAVLGKSATEVKAYWSKLIFSGQGVPPAVVGGDVEVKSWVARTPAGLGYIDSTAVDSSVKVLLAVP